MTETDRPANPPLWSAIRADASELALVKNQDRVGRGGVVDILTLPGFWCAVLWRLGNHWHERGLRPLSRLAYFANMVLFGADLASGASVGPGVVIPHPVGVGCASDVVFGSRCRVMGQVRIGGSGQPGRPGHPVFGDDVWLMDGAKVFGPVTVGDRSIVAASALVTRDVPPDMIALAVRATTELRPREPAAESAR